MGQDFFKNLPAEILLNILSRLPIPTTMICKFVCKPWLNLLSTQEFVKSHLSKSVPGLAASDEGGTHPIQLKIIDFVDELHRYNVWNWNTVLNFDLPFHGMLQSSSDGLLFLCEADFSKGDLLLCNPITRDYIKLPSPRNISTPVCMIQTYGFGVSKMSGQYKVVLIFKGVKVEQSQRMEVDLCQVYTLGTGSWRRIAPGGLPTYAYGVVGTNLNGNLHWLACEGPSSQVLCLDLETELFSTFSQPPPHQDSRKCRNLSALRDCLCACDNLAYNFISDYEIDIWLMKEYGDDKSWSKEFVILQNNVNYVGFMCPIKVFKNGDILMVLDGCDNKLLYLSSKTKTITKVDDFGFDRVRAIDFTPSFLSLRTFAMENASSF